MQRFITVATVAIIAIFTGAVTQTSAQETGSISGRVTYPDGAPVSRYLLPWWAEGEPIGSRSVLTDDAGNYTISGLAPGTYFVGLFAADRIPADRSGGLEDAPSGGGLPDQAKTRRVVLNGNRTAANVDFVITNVGPERGEGPDSGPGEIVNGLPATGQGRDASPTPWIGLALIVLAGVTVPALGWTAFRRGTGAR